MHRLIYIGSPQFDGIGLLNTEAQKMLQGGALTILDGIVPGAYPEIKNFGQVDYFIWKWIRKAQFFGALNPARPGELSCMHITDLLGNSMCGESEVVRELLEAAVHDHCVCNNLTGIQVRAYRDRHWARHYSFLCRVYKALQALFRQTKFAELTLFNGRNTLAKLLVAVAKENRVPVRWLEYFGKRNGRLTYIASPVDIFDFDAMSDFILESYRKNRNPEKELIARECLNDRIAHGDPLLKRWGINFSTIFSSALLANQSAEGLTQKKIAAFFFSSEDEYPAVKRSLYGFNPPNEQYRAFLRICEQTVEAGLHHKYRFLVKLHPRYAVESAKLSYAQSQWDHAISEAQRTGLQLEIVEPLTSAYGVIVQADIVFSYGSTAWEATYMGKPAILMGPNLFATHDCAHIARSAEDVIDFLKCFPEPKAVSHCYPYAWAWRELGQIAQVYTSGIKLKWLDVIVRVFFNRFSKHEYSE